MEVRLTAASSGSAGVLEIGGSKSESNRLLILKALYPGLQIRNLSNSDDTRIMREALASEGEVVDIHHAGTAMRFLTAYFAAREGREITLTGSSRMKQRPIGILVEALRELGADIQYLSREGYPPLRIKGRRLRGGAIEVPATVSSQYISALLLISPVLEDGLCIRLTGAVSSRPYIDMTCSLLEEIGAKVAKGRQEIKVAPLTRAMDKILMVESDWSSASYFYALTALSKRGTIGLKHYFKKSRQGDSALVGIFRNLAVQTDFHPETHEISLVRTTASLPEKLELDLTDNPDLAQTIAVCCFGLGIGCQLSGLHTLKIKETDRLLALRTELSKLGARITVDDRSLSLEKRSSLWKECTIDTYQDHRMAMSFAPLAVLAPLRIAQPGVVSKSFPDFWKLLEKAGVATEF